jgi:hypothetical protein
MGRRSLTQYRARAVQDMIDLPAWCFASCPGHGFDGNSREAPNVTTSCVRVSRPELIHRSAITRLSGQDRGAVTESTDRDAAAGPAAPIQTRGEGATTCRGVEPEQSREGPPVSQFDIAQYVNFRPPCFLCPRCASIWQRDAQAGCPDGWEYHYHAIPEAWVCGVCNLRFEATPECLSVEDYLKRWGCALDFGDLTDHFRALAEAASDLRSKLRFPGRRKQSLYNLLAALNQAKCFVHVISTGLSWDFIGMLALLSHRVCVRGMFSMDDENKIRRLHEAQDYSGRHSKFIAFSAADFQARPHQKLIVIDGFLAISGSLNLTIEAWSKLDSGNEHIVVETRPEEVAKLNNALFSPIWSRLHPVAGDVTPMRRTAWTWMESVTRARGSR